MNFLTFSKHRRCLPFFIQLKKHQWFDEEYLNAIQEKKLRRLIDHAYQNVPFYHDLFESEGIHPKDIQTLNDLQNIPILTKENVKKNFPNNIIDKNTDLTKCSTRSTTGSSGIPLKIAIGPESVYYRLALFFFVFFSWGLRLRDKVVSIRHSPFISPDSLIGKIGILNWQNISVFDPIKSIAENLKKHKPDVIATYPSLHYLLTEELIKLNFANIKPRFITVHGETLTDSNRNRLMQFYETDIFRQYSTVETGSIAFECKQHSGYHIISDAAIIEVIKDGKKVNFGTAGEIVVTILYNYDMPLIRYNLGDIGILTKDKCFCGRGYPLLKSIEGRIDDFLTLPSGKKISPRTINVIEDIPGVFRYQTIQDTKNEIIVRVVKEQGFNKNTIYEIKKHIISGCLGEDVKVNVMLVDDLTLNKRGKLRTIISNVKE